MPWTQQEEDEFLAAMGEAAGQPVAQPPAEPVAPPVEGAQPADPVQPTEEPAPAVQPLGPERTVEAAPAVGERPPPADDLEWPPRAWLEEDVPHLDVTEPDDLRAPPHLDVTEPDDLREEVARPPIGEEPGIGTPELEPPPPTLEPAEVERDPFDVEIARQFEMSPAEHGVDVARREHERGQQAAERQREIIEATRRAQQEHAEDYQRAQREAAQRYERLNQRAQELAQQDIDPERWWSDRSTGQSIAHVASAAIGGLLAPHYGGQNPALEQINRAIERDIQAQAMNLDHERAMLGQQEGIVAQMYAAAGDRYQAAEMARATSLDLAAQQIEAEAQAFDPRGTAAARARQQADQMRAQAAEARREIQQQEFDNRMTLVEQDRSERDFQLRRMQAEHAMRPEPMGGPAMPEGRVVTDPHTGEELEFGHPRVVVNPRTGEPMVARSEDEGGRLQERLGRYARVRDAASQLRELARTSSAKATEGGRSRFTDQETQDIERARHHLATELAGFHREGAAGRGDIEAMLERIPEPDVWFGRADAEPTIAREITAMDRAIRGDLRQAGIDADRFDPDAGEPPAGFEEGIQEEMTPRQQREIREAITGADVSQPIGSAPLSITQPPSTGSTDDHIEQMAENVATLERELARATRERRRAVEAGEEAKADQIHQNMATLYRARTSARNSLRRLEGRQQAREDAERREDHARRRRTGVVPN